MIEGLMRMGIDIFLNGCIGWYRGAICERRTALVSEKMAFIIFWLLSCFVTFVECVYNEVWSCIIVVIIKVSKKLFFCLKMMIAHLYRRKMAECIFLQCLLYIWGIKTQFLLLFVDSCSNVAGKKKFEMGKKENLMRGNSKVSKLLTVSF